MPCSRKFWVLKDTCRDEVTTDYFEEEEEDLEDLRKGEIMCRALFISVDPITRLHIAYSDPGQPILGRQGKLLVVAMGWSNYSIVDPTMTQEMGGVEVPLCETLPRQLENASLPKSSAMGLLGIPGLTAYLGLTELAKAEEGETIVITSAAGQMGHLVGQLARHMGLRVIGFTGCSDKASWIKTELMYDWAFNYKTQDVKQALNIAAPNGVDIFWDAVGGDLANTILPYMSYYGRVIMVGNLANYGNMDNPVSISMIDLAIHLKELYYHMWEDAREALVKLFKEEKIKPYEHVVEGFEFLPEVFVNQMNGKYQEKYIQNIPSVCRVG